MGSTKVWWVTLSAVALVVACGARTGLLLHASDAGRGEPTRDAATDAHTADTGAMDAAAMGCAGSCFSACTNRACARSIQLAAGSLHSCTLLDSGGVACWGSNGAGQLGDGTFTSRTRPTAVLGLHDAVEVTAGALHTCARRATGQVACWGLSHHLQLGVPAETRSYLPITVVGLDDAVQISAGSALTCAVRASHEVMCWGDSLTPGSPSIQTPWALRGHSDITQVAVGHDLACAIEADGGVICWGPGVRSDGQVPGVSDALQVSAGEAHACAVLRSGDVMCWGTTMNAAGELGDGSRLPRLEPVRVAGLDAVQVNTVSNHTCARRVSGEIVCWGENRRGQLGFSGYSSPAPLPVDGLGPALEVHAGSFHTCARRQTSVGVPGVTQVLCWGSNVAGQLGDGTTTDSFAPVLVAM